MKRKVLSIFLVLSLIAGSVGFAFADTSYTVKDGDVLWKIAQKNKTTWQALAEYNKLADPNLIYVNQKLSIPDGTTPAPTTVEPTTVEPTTVEPTPVPVDDQTIKVPAQVQDEYNKFLTAVDQKYA